MLRSIARRRCAFCALTTEDGQPEYSAVLSYHIGQPHTGQMSGFERACRADISEDAHLGSCKCCFCGGQRSGDHTLQEVICCLLSSGQDRLCRGQGHSEASLQDRVHSLPDSIT